MCPDKSYGGAERRSCFRFEVPGATVRIDERRPSLFGIRHRRHDRPYPVEDVSRGGLRVTLPGALKEGTLLSMELCVPGEAPLHLEGTVRWSAARQSRSDGCLIGIRFLPFGSGEGRNPREAHDVLALLEQRFVDDDQGRGQG